MGPNTNSSGIRAANGIELSDDRTRLDLPLIHAWLSSSYWSPGIAFETMARAFDGSHCLGAYFEGGQVGFARMITDHASFAWLADVWVAQEARGQGIAQQMLAWFLARPDYAGMRRIGLATRDAHDLYRPLGFRPLECPAHFMERLSKSAPQQGVEI